MLGLLAANSRRFCRMKYYKEIAAFLKIKVPVLNQEILIAEELPCVVHGIKKLQTEDTLPLPEATLLPTEGQTSQNPVQPQQPASSLPLEPLYIYQKYSQEVLPFGKAVSVSRALEMDLSLMREGREGIHPILSMSSFRKHVYSEYFLGHIRRRGREGWKNIRLGERIEDNDIRTKTENINRMVRAGERRFKLHSLNDSERSKNVLIEFSKFFGKEIEPELHTVTNMVNGTRRKEERWVAQLLFEEEVQVDFEQVNKKWRRRQFQQNTQRESPERLRKLFEDDDVRMERELYNAYKDLNIQMPERFEKLAQDERNMENDRFALYRNVDEEETEDWDEEEQASFKQKMDRHNKEFFKERTATEIVEEMEKLKSSGYESEAHKVARFRKLKEQLQNILKKHSNTDL